MSVRGIPQVPLGWVWLYWLKEKKKKTPYLSCLLAAWLTWLAPGWPLYNDPHPGTDNRGCRDRSLVTLLVSNIFYKIYIFKTLLTHAYCDVTVTEVQQDKVAEKFHSFPCKVCKWRGVDNSTIFIPVHCVPTPSKAVGSGQADQGCTRPMFTNRHWKCRRMNNTTPYKYQNTLGRGDCCSSQPPNGDTLLPNNPSVHVIENPCGDREHLVYSQYLLPRLVSV